MALPVNNEGLPSNTSLSTADAPLKRIDVEKDNHESASTEKKAAAAYSSITPILCPIPQRAIPLSGHLDVLIQDNASCVSSSEDKISRFFRECFPCIGSQGAAGQGLWSSKELQEEYLKVLSPYQTSLFASRTADLFFSYALTGYLRFIPMQCQRYEWIEVQFTAEFPNAFRQTALGEAIRKKYVAVFNALGTEYLQIQCIRREYECVLLELEQVKRDREDPCRSMLTFPSVLGSGRLVLGKSFYQDSLMIEQFYYDYYRMLSYNELYLSRFMRAIQQACAILES